MNHCGGRQRGLHPAVCTQSTSQTPLSPPIKYTPKQSDTCPIRAIRQLAIIVIDKRAIETESRPGSSRALSRSRLFIHHYY